MQQVTATAGEVVVAKVPPDPGTWTFRYWSSEYQRWFTSIDYKTEQEALDFASKKERYRIVRIPGEEVKDGK